MDGHAEPGPGRPSPQTVPAKRTPPLRQHVQTGVWSPSGIPARETRPRRTAAAGGATGREQAAARGVRQAGSEAPTRPGQPRPPPSSPDPVRSRGPWDTASETSDPSRPMSGLASGVRSVLPKEAPPRVLSRAETKRHGPVTIAPSAYWAWASEGKAGVGRLRRSRRNRRGVASTPRRPTGRASAVAAADYSARWLIHSVKTSNSGYLKLLPVFTGK